VGAAPMAWLPSGAVTARYWKAGKERRRIGRITSTPLPAQAWPGRITIAKPSDPTRRRSMRCHWGGLGRPSIGLSGPCISSHRTRVRKASQ
jgi:hypothetical protein